MRSLSRGERFVVLGLAHVRASWFTEVARWATAAVVPVEFAKCVSVEELRARLASGRVFSAVLVDAMLPGVDRDLADRAVAVGAAVIVVGAEQVDRDWTLLGASATLPSRFSRTELMGALEAHARPVSRGDDALALSLPGPPAGAWRGAMVAVTGIRGSGASTVAMAVAQGLASDARHGGLVVLADLALDADQALLHDAGDVVPGVQELVDAHRGGHPSTDEIRRMTFDVPARGYHLLLGLRRHRDWAALRPRSVEAAIDGLRRAYRVVVADVEPDFEGEEQCGSADVEERNLLSRAAVTAADVVVAVGEPGVKGTAGLVRLVGALVDHGVAPASVAPVINRAPRAAPARARLSKDLADLCRPLDPAGVLASPVYVPERRRIEGLIRDGARFPASMADTLAGAVAALLDRPRPAVGHLDSEPVAVRPGSLGRWADEEMSAG